MCDCVTFGGGKMSVMVACCMAFYQLDTLIIKGYVTFQKAIYKYCEFISFSIGEKMFEV